MRIVWALGIVIFMGLTAMQVYDFLSRRAALSAEFSGLNARVEDARVNHDSLQADLEYFMHPENFEKELRARFNFRGENETMIILVPEKSTSTPGSGLDRQ